MTTTLTFVGIGAIGLPMATQLKQVGYAVTGVDPMPAARDRAESAGLASASHIVEAAQADTVIVMVATPQQLEALIEQAGNTVKGQAWIIMSTVGPEAIQAQSKILIDAGAQVVDAPVTGGAARALDGQLVIFASGDASAVQAVAPILEALGTLHVIGERLGDGQRVKVVNQHLCAIHIVAAAEALSLAESLGLDRTLTLDLVKNGAAGSWMLSDRGPRMLANADVTVQSTINIFVKDSGLVEAAADASGADIPLLRAAAERYHRAGDAGLGLRDDSSVIETYRQ